VAVLWKAALCISLHTHRWENPKYHNYARSVTSCLSVWYSHAAYYRLWRGAVWYIASNVLQPTATNLRVTDGGVISRKIFESIAKDSHCNTSHSTMCVWVGGRWVGGGGGGCVTKCAMNYTRELLWPVRCHCLQIENKKKRKLNYTHFGYPTGYCKHMLYVESRI
jgi:hypothetical protein